MNRRGFLGALLAVPSLAKAAMANTGLASGGFVSGVPLKFEPYRAGEAFMPINPGLPKMQEQVGAGYRALENLASAAYHVNLAPQEQYYGDMSSIPQPQVRKGDWMQLASGRAFHPLDPRPEEIHIEDIAAALSKLCRYGGHSRKFYSVAEHSVLMAHVAPDGMHLAALLHDASEAYLSDVIRPIKSHLTNYLAIEAELERVIAQRFTLQHPMPPEVKRMDNAILADERDQAMGRPPHDWRLTEPPLGVTLQFWSPEKAEYEFLAAFRRYGGHWC